MHARTRQIREAAIQAYLINKVRNAGHFAVKITCPSRKGIPDVLLIVSGSVHFVEVKVATRSRTSASQSLTMKQMMAAGAQVAIVRGLEGANAYLAFLFNREKP